MSATHEFATSAETETLDLLRAVAEARTDGPTEHRLDMALVTGLLTKQVESLLADALAELVQEQLR